MIESKTSCIRPRKSTFFAVDVVSETGLKIAWGGGVCFLIGVTGEFEKPLGSCWWHLMTLLLHFEQFIWMPKEEYFARNCSSAYLCFSNFVMYILFVLGFSNNPFMVELIFLLQVLKKSPVITRKEKDNYSQISLYRCRLSEFVKLL